MQKLIIVLTLLALSFPQMVAGQENIEMSDKERELFLAIGNVLESTESASDAGGRLGKKLDAMKGNRDEQLVGYMALFTLLHMHMNLGQENTTYLLTPWNLASSSSERIDTWGNAVAVLRSADEQRELILPLIKEWCERKPNERNSILINEIIEFIRGQMNLREECIELMEAIVREGRKSVNSGHGKQ